MADSAPAPAPEDGRSMAKSDYKRYVPLDAPSWGHALLTVLGWLLVPSFAILSTVLFYMYEMKIINVSDRDVRDLYMDQRLMTQSSNYTHRFFKDAITCCNPDPVVFKEPSWGCSDICDDFIVQLGPITRCNTSWACPPLITIECPGSLISSDCNQARGLLYPLVGLDNVTGAYTSCSKAGLIRVGASLVAPDQQLTYVATYSSAQIGRLAYTNQTTSADVAALVNTALLNASTEYVNPNIRLDKSLFLGGQPIAPLSLQAIPGKGNRRTINPWPFPIFNWPGAFKGGNRCPKSATGDIWYLTGQISTFVPAFNYTNPTGAVTDLTFYNDQILVSYWKVASLPASETIGQLTDSVSLQVLSGLQVSVGMMRDIGTCFAWMIDESQWGTNATYTETITVTVNDAAAPMPIALPFYGGMWYIVMCFAMAAIWVWTLGPFIVFAIPLIWLNVRVNKGLPPPIYRYMRKYRGW